MHGNLKIPLHSLSQSVGSVCMPHANISSAAFYSLEENPININITILSQIFIIHNHCALHSWVYYSKIPIIIIHMASVLNTIASAKLKNDNFFKS